MNVLRSILLLAAMVSASAAADQQLSIATGGTGGVYFPVGGGMAEIINSRVEGYAASAEVTGGSVENMGLIAMEDADIAFSLADTARQAYLGQGRFNGRPLTMLRTLVGLYDNLVQVVTLSDSGIDSLNGLKGKRVSMGAPGSGTEVNARALLKAVGVGSDAFEAHRLNFNETADALRNGDIDAGFWSVAAPNASILNLATGRSIRLLPLGEDERRAALDADPAFRASVLTAATYPGVDADVPVLAVPNVLVVSADMPDALAYAITRAFFEQVDRLVAIHPAVRQMTAEYTLQAASLPLHPGTVRYLRERGLEVPEALLP